MSNSGIRGASAFITSMNRKPDPCACGETRTKAAMSVNRPSVETPPPGRIRPGGGEVRPLADAHDPEPRQVQLAPVMAVDEELISGLEVVDHVGPFAVGGGPPGVGPVAPEVEAQDGVAEALQVLGQARHFFSSSIGSSKSLLDLSFSWTSITTAALVSSLDG